LSIEAEEKIQPKNQEDEFPEWDDTGESILRYELLKIRYDGP
jgi:hypothetical protein